MPGLAESASALADALRAEASRGGRVRVTVRAGCDGLAAGGILAAAVAGAGARLSVSAARELDPEAAAPGGPGVSVIADMGAGAAAEIGARGGEWFVIDHHPLPASERDEPRVINAWSLGLDGAAGACSAAIAHAVAGAAGAGGPRSAAAAAVGALGDGQDSGPDRALSGLNAEAAAEAEAGGALASREGLLLAGARSRPLAAALASTTRPFIEGLAWSEAAASGLLRSAGVAEREGGRLRTPADLSPAEAGRVVDAVAALAPGAAAEAVRADMVGAAYELSLEEPGPLRDAREMAAALAACGRSGRAGAGLAVCAGGRGAAAAEAAAALAEHREGVARGVGELLGQRWRVAEGAGCVVVNGEGVLPEGMSGAAASVLAGSPRHAGRVVVVRAGGGGGTVRVSSRRPAGCPGGADLGEVMREGAAAAGGSGGGGASAAGARVPRDGIGGLLDYIESRVVQGQGVAG